MRRKQAEKSAVKKVKTSMALPEDLWQDTRILALRRGVDAQDIVAKALELYLRKEGAR
jgi:hypothetical protein